MNPVLDHIEESHSLDDERLLTSYCPGQCLPNWHGSEPCLGISCTCLSEAAKVVTRRTSSFANKTIKSWLMCQDFVTPFPISTFGPNKRKFVSGSHVANLKTSKRKANRDPIGLGPPKRERWDPWVYEEATRSHLQWGHQSA